MWINIFDEIVESFVCVRKILARFDIRYQTHHGAIGAVPEDRIP